MADKSRLDRHNKAVERRYKVKLLREQGLRNADIARKLNVCHTVVSVDFRALDFAEANQVPLEKVVTVYQGKGHKIADNPGTRAYDLKRQQARDERREQVKLLHESGKGRNAIASQLGVSIDTIYRDMRALGIVADRARTNNLGAYAIAGSKVTRKRPRKPLNVSFVERLDPMGTCPTCDAEHPQFYATKEGPNVCEDCDDAEPTTNNPLPFGNQLHDYARRLAWEMLPADIQDKCIQASAYALNDGRFSDASTALKGML